MPIAAARFPGSGRLTLAALLLAAGCSSRHPLSGYPLRYTGETHVRLLNVWVVTVPSPIAGYPEHAEVIYENGARIPADGPSLHYRTHDDRPPRWSSIPTFRDEDYPLILFGEHDRFVAARRASDGAAIEPDRAGPTGGPAFAPAAPRIKREELAAPFLGRD